MFTRVRTHALSAMTLFVLLLSLGWVSPARAGDVSAGTLAGDVTSAAGGVSGAVVHVLDPVWGVELGTSTADGSGHFATDLAPGGYRLWYTDPSGAHVPAFSGGSADWPSSSVVTVTAGETTDASVSLQEAGSVTGTVVDANGNPVGGIWVLLADANEVLAGVTVTAGDGTYSIAGLSHGDHLLSFADMSGTYPRSYWPNASTRAAADVVRVGAGATVADQMLPATGSLSGSVTIGAIAPAADVLVAALHANSFELAGFAFSGTDGAYSIANLPAGSYKLVYIDLAVLTNVDVALRPVFGTSIDLVTVGLSTGYDGASIVDVAVGEDTAVAGQALAGLDCDPTVVLPGLDLTGADLSGSDYRGCNLDGVVLAGADLTGAQLLGATGSPVGSESAVYDATVCPDGTVTEGVSVVDCSAHGIAA